MIFSQPGSLSGQIGDCNDDSETQRSEHFCSCVDSLGDGRARGRGPWPRRWSSLTG